MTLTAFSSKQTVQTADIQNAPCGFCETASGKLLVIYNPSAAHAGSGSISIRTAADEVAANAGTFSSATALETEDATWYYSPGGLMRIREGANKGRVWAAMNRAAVSGSPKALNIRLRYTDDPDSTTPTWSSAINVSAPLGDGTGNGDGSAYGLTGLATASPVVEVPETAGQTLLLPVWTYDGSNTAGYVRLLRSVDGGATWSTYSTIAAYSASYDTSEHHLEWVRLPSGTLRLICSIVYVGGATADIRIAYSDDSGATWSSMSSVLSNATASPAIRLLRDGRMVMLNRNLSDSENTWLAVSSDRGASWSQMQELDGLYRMRYGNMHMLRSGHLGIVWATESDSTHAGVYFRSFVVPLGSRTQVSSGRGLRCYQA